MRKLPIALALTLAAAAPGAARNRDRVPEATPTGAPVDCISTTSLRQSPVRSDTVIDFVTRGGQVYRNTLPAACPSLGFEERFSYEVHTAQICSSDIIHVLYSAGPTRGAGCGLGKFQPVKLAPRAR